MKKKLLKQVSLVLIIALLVGVIPQGAIAIEADTAQQLETVSSQSKPEPKVIGEIIEKREKNKKYFLMDDKSISAAIYPEAVHYQKDGKWQDIDNSLTDISDNGLNLLENKANDFKVKFAKKADKNELVRFSKDNYAISWSLDNALKVDVYNKPLVDNIKGLTNDEKIKTLKNRSSIVEYKEILKNIDLQYITNGDKVKENIILKNKEAQNSITFTYDFGKLEAKLNEDKTITVFDPSKTEEAVIAFEAPFMYDADQDRCDDITVSLKKDQGNYKLTLIANRDWLEADDTKYPVTIDPTITSKIVVKDIWETYIRSGQPNTSKAGQEWITAGHSQFGTDRIVIKFANLVPLTSADKIVSAKMYFQASNWNLDWDYTASNPRNIIEAHEILYDWENLFRSSSVTWNNMYSLSGGNEYFSNEVIDYAVVGKCFSDQGYYNTYSWDLTKLAKKWYETGVNYGVTLKYGNETVNEWPDFWSSDGTTEAVFPVIYFNYRNTSGIEDYWTYHSQSNGRAGTGYVNDYTGNVVWVHNDAETTGNKMPISVNHVYNASRYMDDNGLGRGWQLSNNELLGCTYTNERALFDSGYQYYLIDSDGTKHFFIHDGSGKHTDEDALGLSLQYDTNRWVMTDKKGNKKEFSDNGLLIKVIDTNGNSYTQTYTSINGFNRLTKVTDGVGRDTVLSYTTSGRLTTITDSANRVTQFIHDNNNTGNYLERIQYPDNTQTVIGYGGPNCMISCIRNIDQNAISYEYNSATPYRAKKYYEADWSNTGTVVDISYNHNETIFKENNDNSRIFTYQFTNWGHTVCVKDAQGNAQYYAQGTSGGTTNKTTMASKMQKTTTNLLRNHNGELDSDWGMYCYQDGGPNTFFNNYTTEAKYIGNRGFKLAITNKGTGTCVPEISQTVTLEKGKTYTMSAYVKTSGISSTTNGAMFIVDIPGVGCQYSENLINNSDEWQRLIYTFTVPLSATSNSIWAYLTINNVLGAAYFDCVQLEEGETANRYNLLQNNGFEFNTGSPACWIPYGSNSNDTVINTNSQQGINSYRITGDANTNKGIVQTLNISGANGDSFVVGGWGKANSVDLTGGRYFALDVCVNYTDSTQEYFVFQFNYGTSEWQYLCDQVVAKKAYSSISVYALYYQNANTAYFDGLQFYKEEFGQSYQYDANGNIKSTADLAKQQTTFANDNNNLTKLTTPEGSNFNYVYDSKKNITSAKSSDGTKYSFTYDDYGNPTNSKVESFQTYPDMVDNQVYYIKAKNTGLYLDAFGPAPGDVNGNSVGQAAYTGYENQQWRIVPSGSGYYKLQGVYSPSGKVLDVTGGANANGTPMQMYSNVTTVNQEFKFEKCDDGSYKIKARCTNETRAIDVADASYNTGALAVLWEIGGSNQQWFFEPVGTTPVKVDRVTSGNTYYLKNVMSGLYLHAWAYADAPVQQNTFNKSANEQWIITEEGANGYSLKNAATSDQYLAVQNETNIDATQIQIEPKIGGVFQPSQYWKVVKNGDGTFSIKSSISNYLKGLDLESGLLTPNARIALYTFGGSTNQKWILEAVSTPSTSINSSAEYYPNSTDNRLKGNYVSKVVDARGNDVNYDYNPLKGTLNSVSDAKDKTTSYTYNANTDALESVSKNVTINGQLQTAANSYSYENDKLHFINHNSFSYHFGYDWAGNNTWVNVGTQNLITNQYNISKGLLDYSTYGNGHHIDFSYDEQDRVIEKKYNNNSATSFKYVYNNNGNLGILKDFVNNNTITYTYDLIDRLTKISQTNGLSLFYSYDSKNRASEKTVKLGNITNKTGFIYGDQRAIMPTPANWSTGGYRDEKAGLLYGITVNGVQRLAYDYDYLNRLSSRTLNTTNPFTTKYDFIAGSGTNTTTTMLAGITNGSNAAISYSYDDNGNIETISEGGVEKVKYYYDELNQLVREDTVYQNKTITYTFDVGGNIRSKKEYTYQTSEIPTGTYSEKIYQYAYEDRTPPAGANTAWKDLLTKYGNDEINYDAIGNPTAIGSNWTFAWQNGRQMQSTTKNGITSSYKYNDSGIRTQKIYNGVTTNYYLDGDKVAFERSETNQVSGGTATDYGASNPATEGEANAFDSNSSTKWLIYSATGAIGYTYNSGVTKVVNKYTITSANDAPGRDPKAWHLQGSNDGVNWTTIDTRSNITFSNRFEKQTFYADNATAYNMYRLNITQNSGDPNYTQLADIELMNSTEFDYSYDENGNLFSFKYNGSDYYYIRNGQSDIIGILDSTGTQVVSYTYDSWGKLLSTTGTRSLTVGAANPYLYRGYRYDAETGLFYVGSRYYNPEWGRYLNADDSDVLDNDMGSPVGKNLFTYCQNNPVNHSDSNGYWVLDAIFLAADIAEFAMKPSWGGAAMILLDVACFADPSGAASSGTHAVKAGATALKVAKAVDKGKDALKIADKVKDTAKVTKNLRRPYIRKGVREAVEKSAKKSASGKFIDPNTLKEINGKYDLGHKAGSEFRRLKAQGEAQGMTQKQFNDWLNNPKWYQIEDPISNRSHMFEMR